MPSRLANLKRAEKNTTLDQEIEKEWYLIVGSNYSWIERYFSEKQREKIWGSYQRFGFEVIPVEIIRKE